MVEVFGGALVEDAAQGAEGLVGFVIFLEFPVVFFADDRTGLAAVGKVLGLDDLFIKLLEEMLKDEAAVLFEAVLLALIDGAVVEAEELIIHGVHIDAKGAAGHEAGDVAVLFGGAQVDADHRVAVILLEVAVDFFGVFQVGVIPVAAEDAGGDVVVLQEAAAQPAAAGPIFNGQNAPFFDLIAADDALVGAAGGRAKGKNPHPIAIIFAGVAIEDGLLEGVEADKGIAIGVGVAHPEHVRIDGFEADLDLPILVVEDED